MLRLTEIKLPITHKQDEIAKAILKRLGLNRDDLTGYTVFKRGVDARRPAGAGRVAKGSVPISRSVRPWR